MAGSGAQLTLRRDSERHFRPTRCRGPSGGGCYTSASARMENDPVRRKFTAALDALVEDIQQDRSILAAILCGSLSHDTVWAQSDIDLALVTVDDRKVPAGHTSLYADGLNVHAML